MQSDGSFNVVSENKRETLRDVKIISLEDRSTNTISKIQAGISVAIQYNWETSDAIEEKSSSNSGILMMHFNPNNYYGLKGDVFYNSQAQIFTPQSKCCELQTNIFFEYKKTS